MTEDKPITEEEVAVLALLPHERGFGWLHDMVLLLPRLIADWRKLRARVDERGVIDWKKMYNACREDLVVQLGKLVAIERERDALRAQLKAQEEAMRLGLEACEAGEVAAAIVALRWSLPKEG